MKRINFYLLQGLACCFMAGTYLKPLLSVLKWSKLPNTVQGYEHGTSRNAMSISGAAKRRGEASLTLFLHTHTHTLLAFLFHKPEPNAF